MDLEVLKSKFLPLIEDYEKIAILGIGREGESSYKFLRQLLPNKRLFILDNSLETKDKDCFKQDNNLEFILGENYLQNLHTYDLILKTPGISLKNYPNILCSKTLSSQADLFTKALWQNIIGITGTKGKSTTTSLIFDILKTKFKCSLAGNMGIPFFDILDNLEEDEYIVCEFSSHQLEQIAVPPCISILLNLFEEHLDHYTSFRDYQLSKMNICKGGGIGRTYIYNTDDKLIRQRNSEMSNLPSNVFTFSTKTKVDKGLYAKNGFIYDENENQVFDLKNTNLLGSHNVLNLMAAIIVCRQLGINYTEITEVIKEFKPLAHRFEYVGNINGRYFFNDSISTIPQATIAALETLKSIDFVNGMGCLILGGFDRGIDYNLLVKYLSVNPIKSITFVGVSGERIFKLLKTANALPYKYLLSDDYKEIVEWAYENTKEGEACVLSPAAASYDSFKNFEERGDYFKRLVLEKV